MDVIYMENTECFEIINRLSVRIAKDESDQLKGSGILFLRQVGEMAVVFTAAHVIIDIFKEGESQICLSLGCMDSFGNPQKINVEAKLAMNISDFVPEEGSICIHPDYMQTDPSSIADIASKNAIITITTYMIPFPKLIKLENCSVILL